MSTTASAASPASPTAEHVTLQSDAPPRRTAAQSYAALLRRCWTIVAVFIDEGGSAVESFCTVICCPCRLKYTIVVVQL
jgi:hypothetical protein